MFRGLISIDVKIAGDGGGIVAFANNGIVGAWVWNTLFDTLLFNIGQSRLAVVQMKQR